MGKTPLAQKSANRKYLTGRPPDAADLTTFYRAAGVRNLPIALALATYINDAGRCDPGQRALSARARAIGQADMHMCISLRDGFSPSMINRRIKALVEAGIITQQHRSPTETCRYQVTAKFLPAMRELRLRLCRDFGRFWRPSPICKSDTVSKLSRASSCFIDETKGVAGSTQQPKNKLSTEPSESPTVGRSEEASRENLGECAEGSADAAPGDIEVGSLPEPFERSSTLALHPRTQAAPAEANSAPCGISDRCPSSGCAPRAAVPAKAGTHDGIVKGIVLSAAIMIAEKGSAMIMAGDVSVEAVADAAIVPEQGPAFRRENGKPKESADLGVLSALSPKNGRAAQPPDGPTLKAYKRKLWIEDINGFVAELGDIALQDRLWAAQLADDEAETRQLLDEIDAKMRAAGWRSSPKIRARRRLNRRGSTVPPEERERRKQYLMAKVARWLAARAPRDAVGQFWAAMAGPNAQEIFDKAVAAYRASGWQDRG